MMASERTRLARIGKNDRRDRRGRDQGQTRENQQRDNQGRDNQGATGTRKAAAAVAGGVVGIARTGVTAVVAAILNATTSR